MINEDILYWIGLSDLSQEGTWRWQDQESHQIPSTKIGLQGNLTMTIGIDGNCVVKIWFLERGGKWSAYNYIQ